MSVATSFEVNFDGIVGLSHNYSGLSYGNVASSAHGGLISSPRAAALQGLKKMMELHRLGLKQAVLPPQERPHIPTLRRLGFSADDDIGLINKVAKTAPEILASVCSASSMWVANAATISPSFDTSNGKTHITPANLTSMFHRSIEIDTTSQVLKSIFSDKSYIHHEALPSGSFFADEGAANHTRFCNNYGDEGIELFVYGSSRKLNSKRPVKFPARQTLESCEAIARSHCLLENKTIYAQQNPAAIDAGVFHNDVIAVGNRNLLFFHEEAFMDKSKLKEDLNSAFAGEGLYYIEVPSSKVSLENAIASYLFNSQLVSIPGSQGTSIIVPAECKGIEPVYNYLTELESEHEAIDRVIYFDLRQSMNNGGGPACLRLRVVMSEEQIANCKAQVFLSDELYRDLKKWIETNYRTQLAPEDLADPVLLDECRQALDELTTILKLGPIYDFQLN
ncbi:MAG TPA: N-succinylarginine dihydrolase [Porticoccaceae bacterium]|nr:N-succinylarginine dihydrolase [Porticoccaceae bacterium]